MTSSSTSFGSHPKIDMKELQAGIQLVKTKYIQLNRNTFANNQTKVPDQGNHASELPTKKRSHLVAAAQPKQINTTGNPLLSFPIRSSLDRVRRRLTTGMRRMENQAKRINQLSAELEAAVLELKVIASEVNPDWRAMQTTQKSSSSRTNVDVCEYCATAVPLVELKPDNSFVLLSKPIDLFQAEREAMLLAQTLRHRSRKKREPKS